MSKVLVWDLPTRVFHWLLTAGFAAAFGIAQFAGEHSAWFAVHMLLGISLGLVVLLRIVWGVIGTRHALFKSFAYRPADLANYLKGALTSQAPRYAGHNPGSVYATYAILALLGVVIATGLLISNGSEAAEDLHVPAVYALGAVVVLHVAGVAWHSWRHKENLTASMITGRKEADQTEAIASSRPWSAAVFAVIVVVVTVGLFRNYDRKRSETTLPLTKTVIQLGEAEHH